MDALIKSLETLIKQSAEAFGPEDPSTLNLQQQLAAVLAKEEQSRKVFWIKPEGFSPAGSDKKS